MEVQFEVLTTQTDLGNIFATFYTKTKKGAYLWSEVYNYKDEKQTGAKINKFEGPLPESTDRQVRFNEFINGASKINVYENSVPFL